MRRFVVVCLTLCYFVLLFFSPFSSAITLLGEERANLIVLFVCLFNLHLFGFVFPLPLSVWEGLRFVIVALPGLFSYLFLNVQRLLVSQKQVEELGEKENLTLLSYETTKHDKRMEGMHCTDSEGRDWVLGLRQIGSKAATNMFNSFQEILGDIDRARHASNNERSRQILANITARVSDRAATELKLGELIEEAHLEVCLL